MKLSETLELIRMDITMFVNEHSQDWELYKENYKKKFGVTKNASTLSMQSYISSDLLIDFCTIVQIYEEQKPIKIEMWIRNSGTHLVVCKEQADIIQKVFGDILGKLEIYFNGTEFEYVKWIEDDMCCIKNKLIK